MHSKLTIFTLVVILTTMSLAACAPAQAAPSATPVPSATPANAQGNANNFPLPIEAKLAAGTLILEGSNAAISADQAKKLLPLWQQVQTLSADTNTTPDQFTAVYTQIQGVMTPTQMEAINTITIADLQNEMQKLGIQMPQGFGQGGTGANAGQRATRVAELETATAQGTPNPGGGFGFRGGTPGTPDPNRTPGAGFQGTPNPNRTPGAGFGGGRGGGFANLLLDPLIQMLQKTAGS